MMKFNKTRYIDNLIQMMFLILYILQRLENVDCYCVLYRSLYNNIPTAFPIIERHARKLNFI